MRKRARVRACVLGNTQLVQFSTMDKYTNLAHFFFGSLVQNKKMLEEG